VTQTPDKRQGPDRRRQARGGRRPEDEQGFSPLVLVAYEDQSDRATCEAILAKLHFAVAPVDSMEKAISILPALRPDIVVSHVADATLLRHTAKAAGIPIVEVDDRLRDADALVDAIRRALRAAATRES